MHGHGVASCQVPSTLGPPRAIGLNSMREKAIVVLHQPDFPIRGLIAIVSTERL